VQQWEYRILTLLLDPKTQQYMWGDRPTDKRDATTRLNELGWEGWELVATLGLSNWAGSDWSGRTTEVSYYFKRHVPTPPPG
jgi:hypothetical protein